MGGLVHTAFSDQAVTHNARESPHERLVRGNPKPGPRVRAGDHGWTGSEQTGDVGAQAQRPEERQRSGSRVGAGGGDPQLGRGGLRPTIRTAGPAGSARGTGTRQGPLGASLRAQMLRRPRHEPREPPGPNLRAALRPAHPRAARARGPAHSATPGASTTSRPPAPRLTRRAPTVANRRPPAANGRGARGEPIGRAAKRGRRRGRADPIGRERREARGRVRTLLRQRAVRRLRRRRAMLRLATKLVAFFWRRADGPADDAGSPGSELAEGASRGGALGGRGGQASCGGAGPVCARAGRGLGAAAPRVGGAGGGGDPCGPPCAELASVLPVGAAFRTPTVTGSSPSSGERSVSGGRRGAAAGSRPCADPARPRPAAAAAPRGSGLSRVRRGPAEPRWAPASTAAAGSLAGRCAPRACQPVGGTVFRRHARGGRGGDAERPDVPVGRGARARRRQEGAQVPV